MTWRVTIITATSEVVVLSSSTPNIILVHDKMGHGRRSAFFCVAGIFTMSVQCSAVEPRRELIPFVIQLLSSPPSLPLSLLLRCWLRGLFTRFPPRTRTKGRRDDGERDFHQPLCHSTLIHATQFPAKL